MGPQSIEQLQQELTALRAEVERLRSGGISASPAVDKALWLTSILAHSPDIISIVDREGRLLYVNRAPTGEAPAEALGQVVADFLPDADRAIWHAAIERVWVTGEAQSIELCSVGGLWWSARLAPIREGDETAYVLSLASDITARRRAEHALQQKEEQLQLALEASGMGQWSWELGAPHGVWDPAMRRIMGWPAEGPVPSVPGIVDYVHSDDRERVRAQIERVIKRGERPTIEHRFVRPDGREITILVSARPILAADGSCQGMHGLMLDVTQQRRGAAEAEHAQRLEALGQLAGGVAHDFNNLLVAIMGNIELAAASSTANERASLLAEALSSSARAAELTRQLLAFGRRQHIHERPVDVLEMLEDTLKLLRRLIPESIEIELRQPAPSCSVLGDRPQLEQVVVNLCINARDAMPDGGRLVLATDLVDVDDSFVATHGPARRGRYVRIAVTDDGCGIEPAVLAHVFEPFFTTKESGTGLGLASAYGVVKQHGGFIEVQSESGRGASFEVYLPAAEPSAKLEASRGEPLAQGGAEHVLLAEDEDPVRRVVALILSESGYRVREARNGEEAVRMFAEAPHEIDLVLLDAVMPRKSGTQAAAEIRALRPDVAIILSSGYSDVLASDPKAIGDLAFLAKPYEPNALLQMVRRALDARRRASVRG